MCMHINKTRRNNHVLSINGFCIGVLSNQSLFNGNNPVPLYTNISPVPAVACSINNTAIGDDEVGGLLGKQNCRQEKKNKEKLFHNQWFYGRKVNQFFERVYIRVILAKIA